MAGREVARVAAQHLGRDHRGGLEQLNSGIDRFGAGVAGGVGEHLGMLGCERPGSETACSVGHLGNLIAGLGGALGAAGAQPGVLAQRRAA